MISITYAGQIMKCYKLNAVHGNARGNITQISLPVRQMYARREADRDVIRPAGDDDVLPAFRRCLPARGGLTRTGFAEARDY
jgi:hypothetical protein